MKVEELLQEKRIDFKISGQDYVVKCLNPEHDDNNPSMRIDSITGIFNCFSCGFKGNLFKHFGAAANFLEIKRDSDRFTQSLITIFFITISAYIYPAFGIFFFIDSLIASITSPLTPLCISLII